MIANTDYFINTGSIITSSLFGGSLFNSDTFINRGIIDLDTAGIGLSNQAFFLNDTNGKIFADFMQTSVNNLVGGNFNNLGEIWIARDTGIGNNGIRNNGIFNNFHLINIGQHGPVYQYGLDNYGQFYNQDQAQIIINIDDHLVTFQKGILNRPNASFYNNCAYIQSKGAVIG